MKPSLSQMMVGAATFLTREVIPNVKGDSYAIASTGTIGMMMMLMAQENDRMADTLVVEIDALQALFAEASKAPLKTEMKKRLAEAAQRPRASLKISALQEDAAALKALLIELHVTVEAEKFDWAEELEKRIWEILNLSAQCRLVYMPTL